MLSADLGKARSRTVVSTSSSEELSNQHRHLVRHRRHQQAVHHRRIASPSAASVKTSNQAQTCHSSHNNNSHSHNLTASTPLEWPANHNHQTLSARPAPASHSAKHRRVNRSRLSNKVRIHSAHQRRSHLAANHHQQVFSLADLVYLQQVRLRNLSRPRSLVLQAAFLSKHLVTGNSHNNQLHLQLTQTIPLQLHHLVLA